LYSWAISAVSASPIFSSIGITDILLGMPEPYNTWFLTDIIRGGKFSAAAKKIVLVGHSFGSVVSNKLLAGNPDLVDGAVLTGIGYAVPDTFVVFEAWQPRLARLQSPGWWRQLDGGYITWVDIFANINTFFKFPFYDAKTVIFADDNKQPFSLMELITLSITDLHAPKFVDPVLVCGFFPDSWSTWTRSFLGKMIWSSAMDTVQEFSSQARRRDSQLRKTWLSTRSLGLDMELISL
jgi:pimeloyl-ACP methyl ester carboxylesterase